MIESDIGCVNQDVYEQAGGENVRDAERARVRLEGGRVDNATHR